MRKLITISLIAFSATLSAQQFGGYTVDKIQGVTPSKIHGVDFASAEEGRYYNIATEQCYIVLDNPAPDLRPDDFTLLIKIYIDNQNDQSYRGIFSTTESDMHGWMIGAYSINESYIQMRMGNSINVDTENSPTTVTEDAWITIGVTYTDSDSTFKIYSEGSKIDEFATAEVNYKAGVGVSIGRYYNNSTNFSFEGKIDWVWYASDVIS